MRREDVSTMGADAVLLLTDVKVVCANFGKDSGTPIHASPPQDENTLEKSSRSVASDVKVACDFADTGYFTKLGQLGDTLTIPDVSALKQAISCDGDHG